MIEQILSLIGWLTDALSYGKRKPNSQIVETQLYESEISLLLIALTEKLQKEINSINIDDASPTAKSKEQDVDETRKF